MKIEVINGCKIYIDPDEATMDMFDEIARGCVGFLSASHRGPTTRQPQRREASLEAPGPAVDPVDAQPKEPGSEP